MDTEFLIYASVIFMQWALYLFSTYLDTRQRWIYQTTLSLPVGIGHLMDEVSFEKSRLYNLEKMNFSLIKGFYDIVCGTTILHFALIPWLWSMCALQLESWGYNSQEYESLCSLLFLCCLTLLVTILDQPWSLYSTFVIEARHNFNQQTLLFYIKDVMKSLFVSSLFVFPLILALVKIVQWGGRYFYIYAWLLVFAFMLFFMFIYPDFIAPLFDRYAHLDEGELRTKITELAGSIHFPLTKLLVVEGSKRSNHSNAYFFGFWKYKRIVLFDTLIEGYVMPEKNATTTTTTTAVDNTDECNEKSNENEGKSKEEDEEREKIRRKGCNYEEILAVLAHELGHWKLNHVIYFIIISLINVFLLFFCFGQLHYIDVLYSAFGFQSPDLPVCPTLLRLLLVLQYLVVPADLLMHCFTTWLSRKFEFQADEFSYNMGKGDFLISGLKKLGLDNLSFPVNDPLYAAFNFSHPSMLDRIERLRYLDLKEK